MCTFVIDALRRKLEESPATATCFALVAREPGWVGHRYAAAACRSRLAADLVVGVVSEGRGGEFARLAVHAAARSQPARDPAAPCASGCWRQTAIHSSAAAATNPRRRYISASSSRRSRSPTGQRSSSPSSTSKASKSCTRSSASSITASGATASRESAISVLPARRARPRLRTGRAPGRPCPRRAPARAHPPWRGHRRRRCARTARCGRQPARADRGSGALPPPAPPRRSAAVPAAPRPSATRARPECGWRISTILNCVSARLVAPHSYRAVPSMKRAAGEGSGSARSSSRTTASGSIPLASSALA